MIKTFCDICKREIAKNNNDFPLTLNVSSLLCYSLHREMCHTCYDKIRDFISSLEVKAV